MRCASRALRLAPFGSALIALVASGCAHAPGSIKAGAPFDAEAQVAKRVVVTGSHIPQLIDARTGAPAADSPVRTFSREDLERAGPYSNLLATLQKLDPSF